MIIVDTNIFMYAYSDRIDVIDNLNNLAPTETILVPKWVINELKSISKKIGKQAMGGRYGIKYIKAYKEKNLIKEVNDVECDKNNATVDEKILCLVKKNRWILCTNDKRMTKWAKNSKLRVIGIRSDRRLDFV